MQQANLQVINLDDIVVDENQPRKVFDDFAMEELTSSILKKGVLQPILVRPFGNKYKLVSGERRYRASRSVQAAIKTRNSIPAMIVEMDDTEALEAQIVENLQRKDVNPMEEAVAFKQLQEKYTHQEIGLKVGKSEKYVAQRISLNGLIEDLQIFVYAGKLSLTEAYKLARISPEDQQVLLKEERVPKDWAKDSNWFLEFGNYSFQRVENDLSKATFKTEDKDLYPEMGACGSCRFNSKSNPSLFEDLNKKRICSNSVCFQIKTSRSYAKTIEELIADPNVLLVNTVYGYLNEDQKAKVAEVKKLGAVVLDREAFSVIEEPDELQTWEAFLEEQKEDSDWDEMDAKEQAKQLKEWKDDYACMKEEHDLEMKEYLEDSANARDAFVVVGYDAGKRIKVALVKGKKGVAAAGAAAAGSGASAEVVAIEQEIAGIKERSKRNKELDREKVFKQLSDHLFSDQTSYLGTKTKLLHQDMVALILSMAMRYEISDQVMKFLGKKGGTGYPHLTLFKAIQECEDIDTLFFFVARHFIRKELVSAQEVDREKNGKPAALYSITCEYFPDKVSEVEADQQARANKREANAAKRLEALKTKLKELKAEQTRAANEAAGKKAQAAAKNPDSDKPKKSKKK